MGTDNRYDDNGNFIAFEPIYYYNNVPQDFCDEDCLILESMCITEDGVTEATFVPLQCPGACYNGRCLSTDPTITDLQDTTPVYI